MSRRFTEEQIAKIREVYKETENQAETARRISKLFEFPVARSQIQYWCGLSANRKPVLSENTKKITSASPEECLADLRSLAEANPEVVITRNFYRNESRFSEAAWSEHFGTFEEFKRQAGLKLTRHARKMELDVAKHASVDAFRAMNLQKRDWAESYKRPNSNRFKTHLGISDVHDIECDPFWRRVVLETAKRVQPDVIDINGDLFDLPEFGKYAVDPREWNVVDRIRWVHTFLRELREAAPDAEFNLIEGNHEYRLLRHLAEATPAMKAVLSDLHHMTIPKLLGLDEFQINYIAPADLAVFTHKDSAAQLRRNFLIHYGFYAVCHFPEAETFGMPGWNGHHHKHLVKSHYSPILGTFEWHQSGAGHKREASYCNGEKWSNGFLLTHLDVEKKKAQFEYIDTTAGFAFVGGKFYSEE